MTAEEYIRLKPSVLWIHNLDLLEHVLKADPMATAYKTTKEPSWRAHETFVQEMEKVVPIDGFRRIEEGFNKRLTTVDVASEQGSLNVDRYIGGDQLCFDEPVKRYRPKLARTIIFDYGKNYGEQDGNDCLERYHEVYKQVLEAEENGEPCRVVGGEGHQFREIQKEGHHCLKLFVVIKDYTEPIFPAIWACIKTNKAAWALGNVIADFLVGTNEHSNGRAVPFTIGDDIPRDEDVQIIQSVKITR